MMAAPAFPLAANGAMYDPSQVDEYLAMLFRHVDWQPGQVISMLGIGEKGTTQEGVVRDRQLVAPGFQGAVHAHLKRWAQHHVAGFVVPAVMHADAHGGKGGGALDKVAAHTAMILDIDNGDVRAVAKYVTERLGQPTMIVASGGVTDDGQRKAHLYWLLNEPSVDIERVAAPAQAARGKGWRGPILRPRHPGYSHPRLGSCQARQGEGLHDSRSLPARL